MVTDAMKLYMDQLLLIIMDSCFMLRDLDMVMQFIFRILFLIDRDWNCFKYMKIKEIIRLMYTMRVLVK